jgi:nicotinamidase-related amidase
MLKNLQDEKIDTIVLVGMQTNVCVQGTTKDALKYGFNVIVLKEATAAVDEATHTSTLKALAEKGATVMSVEDVLVKLP